MKSITTLAAAALMAFGLVFSAAADVKPEDTLIITLKDGDVVIELLPDVAPNHGARIKELAQAGEYDNVAFHRVIEGFMANGRCAVRRHGEELQPAASRDGRIVQTESQARVFRRSL